MSTGPIAELPGKANEQHYELPADYLRLILGPRRKYSGCLWSDGVQTLAEAEEAMLALTCQRARVRDGMRILDLGCGWGSLSLWLAELSSIRRRRHVLSHRTFPYRFVGTWAAARFFTAGLMPSHELLGHVQNDLVVADEWIVPGTHYARTIRAWLARLDAHADQAIEVLRETGRSDREARRLLATWRLFLISTEVIWRYRGGNRWLVSHYLLAPRSSGAAAG